MARGPGAAVVVVDALPFNARPRGAALAAAAGLDGTHGVARPREHAAVAAILGERTDRGVRPDRARWSL